MVAYKQLNGESRAIIELKIIPISFSRESTSNKIELIDFVDVRKVENGK